MNRRSTHFYAGENHRSVKRSNRATIFRAIRALGPIARVELARQTSLNPGTVSNIVDELLDAGLIGEAGQGSSRVGRRPVHLAVNPHARFAVGIDLTRSTITGAIVNLAGEQYRRVAPRTRPWTSDVVLAEVERTIADLLAQLSPPERAAIVGIGIGAPGPLSFRAGRFLAPPTFGAWHELDLRGAVEQAFGLPTFVDHNANTTALAELWFGAGQGVDHFVLLTVSTGVAAAIVIDGDLYRGAHDVAGEIGHASIDFAGPQCVCGNYGCLETYVAVPRILAAAQAALVSGEPSSLRHPENAVTPPTLAAFLDAVRDGDELAGCVFSDAVRYLAAGVALVINALDPQLVLLGRDLAAAGDLLLVPLRAGVRGRIIAPLRDAVGIEACSLAAAPVIGAATLALYEFFQAPLGPSPIPGGESGGDEDRRRVPAAFSRGAR